MVLTQGYTRSGHLGDRVMGQHAMKTCTTAARGFRVDHCVCGGRVPEVQLATMTKLVHMHPERQSSLLASSFKDELHGINAHRAATFIC